jgi:hypothetical protein
MRDCGRDSAVVRAREYRIILTYVESISCVCAEDDGRESIGVSSHLYTRADHLVRVRCAQRTEFRGARDDRVRRV